MPTITHTYTYTSSANEAAASVSINGSGEFAAGDFVAFFVTLDGDHASNLSVAGTGLDGLTRAWIDENAVANGVTHACYYKTLVSGDTAETSLDLAWTGNDKICVWGLRIAANDHDGIDGTPAVNENGELTAGQLPAITYGSSTLSIGSCGMDANLDVSVLPTGYTQIIDQSADGAGNCSQWIGSATLSGAQSANSLTVSSARGNIQGILGIAAAASEVVTGAMIGEVDILPAMLGSVDIQPAISGSVDILPAMSGSVDIRY